MAPRATGMSGQILGRTYQLDRPIGVGTVGAVYVARHLRTGSLCAVKLLHRRSPISKEAFQRFAEEARTLSALRHPHIACINDFDRDEEGNVFVVMDLLEGETLKRRLDQRGSLALSQVLEIARDVGGALHAAHLSGILHRNLRPENIFLVRHDLGDRVTETPVVMDFAMGRLRREPQAGDAEGMTGLSQYSAPEAIADPPLLLDARADQFSLAVLCYRALCGRPPFSGESLRELKRQVLEGEPIPISLLAPELPPHVVAALSRGMARNPGDRFESVAEFTRALAGRRSSGQRLPPPDLRLPLLGAQPGSPMSVDMKGQVGEPEKRAPRRLVLAGGALLAVLALPFAIWMATRPGGTVLGGPVSMSEGPASAPPAPIERPLPQQTGRPVAVSLSAVTAPALAVPARPATGHAKTHGPRPPSGRSAAPAPPERTPALEAPRERTEPPAASQPADEGAAPEGEEHPPLQILDDAQRAYVEGQRQQAIALALQVAQRSPEHAPLAWRFIASAACSERDLKLATRAFRHLAGSDRQLLLNLCQQKGLAYLDGEFRLDPW